MASLNREIGELFDSYYEFDSHDLPCWFNEKKEKTDKPRILELPGKLNARIAELNDGSFVVDDQETPRVEVLQPANKPNKNPEHPDGAPLERLRDDLVDVLGAFRLSKSELNEKLLGSFPELKSAFEDYVSWQDGMETGAFSHSAKKVHFLPGDTALSGGR